MKNLLILLSIISLSSCSNYKRIERERTAYVLAVNQKGDTVQIPMSELRREIRPDYYNNYQFYWRDNWYWGYNWYPYYASPYQYRYWGNPYWGRNIIVTPPPRVVTPRVAPPRTATPRTAPPRTTTPRTTTPRVAPPRTSLPRTAPSKVAPPRRVTPTPSVTPPSRSNNIKK
jgi:hypothetical protein